MCVKYTASNNKSGKVPKHRNETDTIWQGRVKSMFK